LSLDGYGADKKSQKGLAGREDRMRFHVPMVRFAALIVAAVTLQGLSTSSVAASGPPQSAGAVDPHFWSATRVSVEALKAPNTLLPPTSGPQAVPDKRIAIITITLAEAAAKRETVAIAKAAAAIGWKSTTYDGQGSATIADQKFAQAIATRPDAIALVALDKNTVGAYLAQAQAANIPVACSSCWDLSAANTRGAFADVEPDLSKLYGMGMAQTQYAYLATGGQPRFLVMTDPALSNLAARRKGFDDFMKQCLAAHGACKIVALRNFQVGNATTTLASDAASLALAHPSFNVFWVAYDFAALNVLNGLRQAGLADPSKSFMVSSNGDGASLQLIEADGYQKCTVAIAWSWVGWAIVDNLNRIFAHQQLANENVPIRLFDKSNAGQAQNGAWDGDVNYRAAYIRSWHR
jgi:ribose transport system substrate-binding protein